MWSSKTKVRVTCVGSVSQDIFFPNSVGEFVDTPEDELAPHKVQFPLGGKVLVEDRYEDIGGVAANVAIGLSRLGISTKIVSRVGDDDLGVRLIERFKKEGVALNGLVRLPNTPSDLSAILVFTQTGERTIFHNRDANERLLVEEDNLKKSEWVFVSALNGDWKKNITTILQSQATLGFKIALNPGQHNLKEDPEFMKNLIRHSEVLCLNHDEAIFLLGVEYAHQSEENILQALHTFGPKYIALTDGARGAWVSDEKNSYSMVPPHVAKVKDSTGAGDAFASGFFAAVLHEHSVEEALRWGIKNSVSVIQNYGATKSLLIESTITL